LRDANGDEEAIRAGVAFVKNVRAPDMRAERQSSSQEQSYESEGLYP